MRYKNNQNSNDVALQTKQLKKINHFLFHLCLMVFAQSIIVSGYLNSINTTIEKRYKLTSREIGFIYMAYEFSCIPTTVILSIIGFRLNRPRILGASGMIMALGMFMFSLPHFVGTTYELIMCNINSTKVLCTDDVLDTSVNCAVKKTDTWALFIFCISQLLIGIGASPIYLLGPTYLWDNLSTKTYSVYSSIFYTCSGFGPPIGFLLGGIFLGIYIDVPKQSKCANMDNRHALWLGAWWIGLVVVACITVVFVAPLLYFPKDILIKPIDKKSDECEKPPIIVDGYGGDKTSKSMPTESNIVEVIRPSSRFSNLPRMSFVSNSFTELNKLLSNPVWLLISLTTVMENSVVQGCSTFISKYLQVVFNVPANHAGYIVGGLVVPGAIVGVAFGGFLMNKLQPNLSSSIKMMIVLIGSAGLMAFVLMFLGCDDLNVVGVSSRYPNSSESLSYNLVSECNSHCHCLVDNYEPICDPVKEMNFYNPCYAGCRSMSNISHRKFSYNRCSCTTTETLLVGKCTPKCPTYYVALVMIFMQVFLTAMGQIPINIITLSSVPIEQSSMALGVQVFLVRVFAFIPVPLYFGAIFDCVCIVRIKDKCNKGSVCREYNVAILPFVWLGTVLCLKLLSFIFAISTYISAKRRQNISVSKPFNYPVIEVQAINFSTPKSLDQAEKDLTNDGKEIQKQYSISDLK